MTPSRLPTLRLAIVMVSMLLILTPAVAAPSGVQAASHAALDHSKARATVSHGERVSLTAARSRPIFSNRFSMTK